MNIQARSVTVSIGDVNIVDEVDLDAGAGVLTGIIGPNGAGKSTLLRVLAGFQKSSSGVVTVEGRAIGDISWAELARLRAFMSSDPARSIDFSVREVVAMGRHPWTSTRQESDALVDRSIEDMDLRLLAGQSYSTLSTGEARRTQVARLLAQGVPVMLADEPVSGLDIGYAEMVLGGLRTAARRGGTVVCVFHDLNAAAQFAGHLALMSRGRVVAAGPPDEVLTETLLTEVYRHPVRVFAHPDRPGLAVLAGESPSASH